MRFKFNALIDFDDNTDLEEIEELMNNIIADLWNNANDVHIIDYGQIKETEETPCKFD